MRGELMRLALGSSVVAIVAAQSAYAGCPADAVVCISGVGATGSDGADFVGGNAGPGGPGTAQTFTTAGPIAAAGNNKDGVRVITAGGPGGVGGDSIVIVNAGNGGPGGAGAAIDLTNTFTISTSGSNSNAITAIADGGRGGDAGGANIIGGGGDGGAGGPAGTVLVKNSGNLTTNGQEARGIYAQANGGSAGFAGGAIVGTAGTGGAPAPGNTVTVDNSGIISTAGARSDGILAQSIGGGGGEGSTGGLLIVARVGGKSTVGHDGGVVNVTSTNNITTNGLDANGILAQSIGGAGGDASGNIGLVAIGGNAAGGGNGNTVNVNAAATIKTNQDGSHGILAQSIGGGGGNGGFSVGVVSIGGDGGSGGTGGDVNVKKAVGGPDLVIETQGKRSNGILAQSVGGGGGDGGLSFAAGPNIAIGAGGTGANGGVAKNVTVDVAGPGSITTHQRDSVGILAQSVGGGGGNGGITASVSLGSVAVGGKGGGGNDGGIVDVTNGLSINTAGDASHGIVAQSVGGGGGRGGAALSLALGGTISVAVGGRGGAGGNANTSAVKNFGDITTDGTAAYAISAQSIGGGGGDGGFAFGVAAAGSPFSLALGGDGNSGGDGKLVDVTSTGANLTTKKDNSHGVYAVSIGGGGGSGGIGGSAALTGSVSIGGQGDSGGIGGEVKVTLKDGADANKISTSGFMSNGIVARSVGGGGGDGGVAVGASFVAGVAVGGSGSKGGKASAVTVDNSLDITTQGALSNGIFAQSIGGGGGAGGTAVGLTFGLITADVAVGGGGAGGGDAGRVEVTNDANIDVHGPGSKAIFAQAIGGGGGDGGAGYSLGASFGIPGVFPSGSAKITVGGFGSKGGEGADVAVKSTGSLTSDGDGIVVTSDGAINGGGILAQSIGGGGGTGGSATTKSLGAFSTLDFALSIGGSGGVGGGGKTVTVDTFQTAANDAKITTKGFNATGILAQSIGGGGGAGGRADTWQQTTSAVSTPSLTSGVTVGGSSSNGATGGTVIVNNRVDVETTGMFAHGVVAESIGGGGGLGASASSFSDTAGSTGQTQLQANVSIGGQAGGGGDGGVVTVTNSGKITTNRDQSFGIWGHSVGGGGGGGGSADADLMVESGTNSTYGAAVGVGGTGGAGGTGNIVTVTNDGEIDTKSGVGSVGILAQSIGGGGGAGGSARANLDAAEESNLKGSIGLGIGGRGNIKGDGGQVTVTNHAKITTGGADAHGIVAQSIGGGGGYGGVGTAATAGKYQIGGGFGGTGGGDAAIDGTGDGKGNLVTVENSGDITTSGRQTFGILAQSVGGGGGAGGIGGSTGGAGNFGINASLGGAGGSAGDGGEVKVTNEPSTVRTKGDGSHAIVAQSLGGGGGAGGASTVANTANYNIGAGLAGAGAASGSGKKVTVENLAGSTIVTEGSAAYGILAQSVGGGGGAGGAGSNTSAAGDLALNFNLGGAGGSSGNGGDVKVTNAGLVETSGTMSHGIVAQSIGGGGGAGGAAKAQSSSDYNFGAGLAGSGGSAGSSGTVEVINSDLGRIVTHGVGAHGILAESIGGGGGAGGTAANASGGSLDISFILGGGGASGGDSGPEIGKAVIVHNDGSIETEKALSFGILAQSVGGGGGASGGALGASKSETQIGGGFGGVASNGGRGGDVEVVNNGLIKTQGDDAVAVFAQSVGGGGGVGGASTLNGSGGGNQTALSVGGFGGSGGKGGDVEVTVNGSIVTTGDRAHGVVAQSVGGGGGYGGSSSSNSGTTLAIGGAGGDGGDGGAVTVVRNGQITTTGADSIAILAQSVGGGGGYGGSGIGRFNENAVALPSFKGTKGENGVVKVTQNANSDILTTGDRAHGIFAQGVAGGGGIGGFATLTADSSFAGSGGGIGNAQASNVTTKSDVRALGGSVYALFAQSVAGQGKGADVTISVEKVARATGTDSVAIYGQSTGNAGAGNIKIDVLNNVVWGGAGSNGAGVLFVGGVDNTLTTDGTLISVNELAIRGGSGNEHVENTRNLIGNVQLGGGTNTVLNAITGLFITDDTVELDGGAVPAAANLLTNNGTLALGGVDVLKTSNVLGNFLQSATGSLPLDIDLNNQTTDKMTVTGTANVAGTGPLLFQSIDKKFNEYVIVTAAQGTTDNGFTPTMDPPAIGFNFMARVDNGTDLVLFAEKPAFADLLAQSSVTDPNAFNVALGLSNIENALSIDDPFNRLINLLRFQPDAETLGLAIVSLTPSAAPHVFEFARRRATDFLNTTGECPFLATDEQLALNGSCFWVKGKFGNYERDDVLGAPTTDDHYSAVTLGLRANIDDAWSASFGFENGDGASRKDYKGTMLSRTETDVWQGSVGGTYRSGGFSIGVVVAGANNGFETKRNVKIDGFQQKYTTFDGILDTRPINFAVDEQPIFTNRVRVFDGISGAATGSSDLWSINPRVHIAYAIEAGALTVTPFVDFDAHYARINAYAETGAGLADLTYARVSQDLYAVTPGLELALVGTIDENISGRAFVRGGVELTRSDAWQIETQFAAAPAGLPGIKITEPYDSAIANLDAGFMLYNPFGVTVRFDYSGRYSQSTTSHEGSASVSLRF